VRRKRWPGASIIEMTVVFSALRKKKPALSSRKRRMFTLVETLGTP
jgi:hypothetical protein